MNNGASNGAGFRQTPETIEHMLSTVRQTLEMDIAFVSRFSDDTLFFRAVEGDEDSFGWHAGGGFPLDDSYCKRVLDGRISSVVPDAKNHNPTRDLRVTTDADIGAYVALPLILSDGRPYGTLCCVSHTPDPWLRERDLRLMAKVASELVRRLEREEML